MTRDDPIVRHFRRPLRHRLPIWVALLGALIAVASLAIGLVVNSRISDEAHRRTQQLQDVICQVYVPIAHTPISVRSSELAKTIVQATRHGAVSIHCPGAQ